MRTMLMIFSVLLITTSMFADGVQPNGTGTHNDPYRVETLDNILWLSTTEDGLDCCYIQTCDIDASETQNWNDGMGMASIGGVFTGSYDGQGYVIQDIYMRVNDFVENNGFFSELYEAQIMNVGLRNVTYENLTMPTGGIAGRSTNSTITNCSVTGTIDCEYSGAGIVFIASNSTITDCWFQGTVGSGTGSAGLVSLPGDSQILNCFYNLDETIIIGENPYGIGAASSEMFDQWLENGMQLNIDDYLEEDDGYYSVTTADDLAPVSFFGQYPDYRFRLRSNLSLSDRISVPIPYFCSEFDGDGYAVMNLAIQQPNFSNIGFFGMLYGAWVHHLIVKDVDLSGHGNVAPLAGIAESSVIEYCNGSGNVEGTMYVSGLIGQIISSTVSLSSSMISVESIFTCGGLVGSVYEDSHITDSYVNGTISFNNYGGGLCGEMTFGSSIDRCYSSCVLDGVQCGGGLVYELRDSEVRSSFWNYENANEFASGPGTGLSDEEMMNIRTYVDLEFSEGLESPWDFTGTLYDDESTADIWSIDEDINDNYPYHVWLFSQNEAAENIQVPYLTDIRSIYPNPFNPETTISFSVAPGQTARLDIFNIRGQRVKSFDRFKAGQHDVVWRGTDDTQRHVASGVYFCRLRTGDKTEVRKLMLLK